MRDIIVHTIFWVSLIVPLYNYFAYALIVWFCNKVQGTRSSKIIPISFGDSEWPETTLLIAAYNEEECIEEKIADCTKLNYPDNKLKIAFVTDGSTDATNAIIAKYPHIQLFYKPERNGKSEAVNRAMALIGSPVVVFCDANTSLNADAITELVKHYADPTIGAVAGEKRIDPNYADQVAGAGEGLYWKYESFLKRMDSNFYSVVGAAGELFSVRHSLYESVEPDTILDDFMISLRINQKGYRVMYEPAAFAMEKPSASLDDEQQRKVRISAGGIQSIIRLKALLNIFKYGRLSFLYISHRVLRWTLTPLSLPLLLLSNTCLVLVGAGPFYQLIWILQILFYLAALIGWFFDRKGLKIKGLYVAYYFVFMNVAVYLGAIRYFRKRQSASWQRAKRIVG